MMTTDLKYECRSSFFCFSSSTLIRNKSVRKREPPESKHNSENLQVFTCPSVSVFQFFEVELKRRQIQSRIETCFSLATASHSSWETHRSTPERIHAMT